MRLMLAAALFIGHILVGCAGHNYESVGVDTYPPGIKTRVKMEEADDKTQITLSAETVRYKGSDDGQHPNDIPPSVDVTVKNGDYSETVTLMLSARILNSTNKGSGQCEVKATNVPWPPAFIYIGGTVLFEHSNSNEIDNHAPHRAYRTNLVGKNEETYEAISEPSD